MSDVTKIFSTMVFDATVMKERLPAETFEKLKSTMDEGTRLSEDVAAVVANAMKDWAIEKGATHYTHWFQPMTGITAEKHDSFISPAGDGKIIMEFSGKELIKGEPDASSFPSGGLRATFEARGYTAWDPTSFAFIKDGVLCIPTAFCSYGGQALDKKTPLLRSMETINKQATRVLHILGDTDVKSVKTTVGAEQEYFLIPKELFEKRKDLIFTGRTLFGAKSPKGQELDDHYFGALKPTIASFMKELDEELWKLGILAKTEHNEAAPSQFEIAPMFTTTNIAADHNQLTMELMQKIAKKHGLVCLLHEKPFAGVNGSGKHNNWSLSTDTGVNLLSPGEEPYKNTRFLLFFIAVIKAVDEYQDLLRISVASAGNDHRLGGYEAPPAIMSIFIGDELEAILDALEQDAVYDGVEKNVMKTGVRALPRFTKDTTDRNRTSPFAFTGNKFEFRMLGSSASISDSNVVLNTIVAEELKQFGDILEKSEDKTKAVYDIVRDVVKKHKRIIFNGNGYDEAWHKEAARRGLLNLASTPECVPHFMDEKNIKLFTEHKVFTEEEMHARYEIYLENYCKVITIEARTMVDMVIRDILPNVSAYTRKLADAALVKKELFSDVDVAYEVDGVKELSELSSKAYEQVKQLEEIIDEASAIKDNGELSMFCKNNVVIIMAELRTTIDTIETKISRKFWPYPTYSELLFGV